MEGLLYALVIIIANSIGAISGMGGGVLIKPILDTIGAHSVAEISFFSTVAVFVMSIVSTGRQIKNGVKINMKLVLFVATGAIIGGVLGNQVFQWFLTQFADEQHVKLIQIILTIATLIFAYYHSRNKSYTLNLSALVYYLICGFILGFTASFLGIGGGPINVSLLVLMFSMSLKDATVYSIVIIFFSQFAKLVTIYLEGSAAQFDLGMLAYIIPAAVIGGLLGAQLNRKMSEEQITRFFQWVIIIVVLINLYNGWQVIF
ncbi:MAG: sulfite exporter TauE/SafE family protein [Aerococcaceae bacterium]|nr:sulfite exporter TauE/SafE family protein [Aerococcaceae bacterium]